MPPSARFWDRIAKRYARTPVADEAAYQHKLAATREYLRPDMQLLEFGCGTGSTALVHAPYVRHIRAIDVSANMLAIAREKAAAAGVANVDFEQATIEEVEVADASLDMVLGLSILHLVDDCEAVLARVHRMLKPGGLFVSSTVCMADAHAWFRLVGPLGAAIGAIPRVRMLGAEELVRLVGEAGFRVEQRWQPSRKKALFLVARKAV